jgi:Lrp/AsnC family leucine-responsive transcriptional regulator
VDTTIEALEVVLDRFLLYGQTTSSFVVSTPVPPRTPAADPSSRLPQLMGT